MYEGRLETHATSTRRHGLHRKCMENISKLLHGNMHNVRKKNKKRQEAQRLCRVVHQRLEDEHNTEAGTAEWSKQRIERTNKTIRHYSRLSEYDIRETDLPIILELLKALNNLTWYAPTGSDTAWVDDGLFRVTLRKGATGFGMNIGTRCEVMDFND
eukprot:COSAG04_NODE_13033_length_623_cov_0.826336_1_plen_156_part_10